MAEATATTRPARKRTASKAAPAKAAPKATEAPKAEETVQVDRIQFEMVADGETKTYAKFKPAPGSGCVGNLYVPKGVEIVKVLLIGASE